jgi:hypothetical protein
MSSQPFNESLVPGSLWKSSISLHASLVDDIERLVPIFVGDKLLLLLDVRFESAVVSASFLVEGVTFFVHDYITKNEERPWFMRHLTKVE